MQHPLVKDSITLTSKVILVGLPLVVLCLESIPPTHSAYLLIPSSNFYVC